jgi:hypothetical protein
MGLAVPFINGKDAKIRLFINGTEMIANAKSWSVTKDVTKVSDGVNGEDRDRLDSFVNFFSWAMTCYMDKVSQVDALLAYDANTDLQVARFDCAVGITFKLQDGSKKAYVGKEIALDDWNVNQTDRKERTMFQLNFRSRYCDQVATF